MATVADGAMSKWTITPYGYAVQLTDKPGVLKKAFPGCITHDGPTNKHWWKDSESGLLVQPATDLQVRQVMQLYDYSCVPLFYFDKATGAVEEVKFGEDSGKLKQDENKKDETRDFEDGDISGSASSFAGDACENRFTCNEDGFNEACLDELGGDGLTMIDLSTEYFSPVTIVEPPFTVFGTPYVSVAHAYYISMLRGLGLISIAKDFFALPPGLVIRQMANLLARGEGYEHLQADIKELSLEWEHALGASFMRAILTELYKQKPEFARALVKTGNSLFIFASRNGFLGVGLKRTEFFDMLNPTLSTRSIAELMVSGTAAEKEGIILGRNIYGLCLLDIRRQLQHGWDVFLWMPTYGGHSVVHDSVGTRETKER